MFKKKQQSSSQPDFPTDPSGKPGKKEGLTGVLSPRQKFEEEVTLDLNTTQTNQEREYREFIMYEIKTESTFIINECTSHSMQLAVSAGIVCIPRADQPVVYALLCYLFLGFVLRLRGRLKRMRAGAKYVLSRTALQVLSLLVTACFLLSDEVLLARICIPVHLLISALEIVQEFLDFSDTIDEVFTVKIVSRNF